MGATLLVALGSALGGAARYWVALLAARWWGEAFPWGTILINVAGSFVIGFFGTLTVPDGPFPAPLNWRVFVMVGLCGGFTTFSSFSLQTLNLARDGGGWSAGANVVASVALCLLAVAAGHEAAERIGVRRASAAAPPLGVVALLDHPATADAVLRAADWSAGVLGQPIEALFLHESLAGFLPTEQVASGTAGRAAIESALRARFAAWRSRGGAGRWRALGGDSAGAIAGQAARAALVVIGHPADGAGDPGRRAADLALFDLGRLTLLVPPQSPSPARHVALAWNPDGSSASAGRAALPFLLRADRVSLLLAREADARETLPDAAFARLREAGVSVSVRRFAAERPIGEALLAEARDAGADLLVMGAVRRGAVAEWIVGGATASILAAADLPVLLRAEPA